MEIPSYLIGIVGGSGSGKTTFANELMSQCSGMETIALSQDNYYKGLDGDADPASYNFDLPEALDLDRMSEDLNCLKQGKAVCIPSYNFVTHRREAKGIHLCPAELVIIEGLFLFTSEKLRKLFDLKIFLDVPEATRLSRRIDRDVKGRGRSRDEVLWRFREHAEPAYKCYIASAARYADMVVTSRDGPEGYKKPAANVVREFRKYCKKERTQI